MPLYVADNVIRYDLRTDKRTIDVIKYKKPIEFMSGTKSIVSMIVGTLYSENLIDIDAPLHKYIPGFDRHNITVKHILTHTSGIDATWNNGTEHFRAKNVYDYVKKLPQTHAPGEHYEYNNNAVELLGEIIKNITGESLLDCAKKYVFGPLNITNISWKHDRDGNYYVSWGLSICAEDLLKIGIAIARGAINNKYMDMIKSSGMLFWNVENGIKMDGYLGQLLYVSPDVIVVRQKRWKKNINVDTQSDETDRLISGGADSRRVIYKIILIGILIGILITMVLLILFILNDICANYHHSHTKHTYYV